MKKIQILIVSMLVISSLQAQTKVDKAIQKTNNAINKVQSIIQVFQPYLIKAKEIYEQGKELAGQIKGAKNNNGQGQANTPSLIASESNGSNSTNSAPNTYPPSGNSYPSSQPPPSYPPPGNSYPSTQPPSSYPPSGNNYPSTSPNNNGNNVYEPQYLPINNPATINNDGTGNWGNQNNGLYGNCLDVLTGTVMGMGEAEETPASVDVIFVAVNGSYGLFTPNFIRNNATATYMTNHSTDGVSKWSTVNETEIAETKITLAQFEQIQTNPQISNVVKNATNYAGWLQYPSSKLDGKVFAIKAELENRTVYGLIAIIKHIGTDGSNGYLKIKVKAMGLDNNNDGRPDAGMYIRN